MAKIFKADFDGMFAFLNGLEAEGISADGLLREVIPDKYSSLFEEYNGNFRLEPEVDNGNIIGVAIIGKAPGKEEQKIVRLRAKSLMSNHP